MGSLFEYIKMAVRDIRSNRGRSVLTMLGIIIGIMSVITIMGLGSGITKSMNEQLEGIAGGQIIFYAKEKALAEKIHFTEEDMKLVEENNEGILGISPDITMNGRTSTGKGDFSISLTGGTPLAARKKPEKLSKGAYYTEEEFEAGEKVCLINENDAKKLFGSTDILGMNIDVALQSGITTSYRVIGVLKPMKTSALVTMGEGDVVNILVPWKSMEAGLGAGESLEDFMSYMTIFTDTSDKSIDQKAIVKKTTQLLDKKHPSGGKESYFGVQSFQDAMSQINNVLNMVTVFTALVAAISLLVGGIGVMNIMLVSVTERTREIGIRKAIGAKTGSIMTQFLAESAILTVFGGMIGIALGFLAMKGIGVLVAGALKMEVHPTVAPGAIAIAVLFSCAVGIFFGMYPARKAARMKPIDALRSE